MKLDHLIINNQPEPVKPNFNRASNDKKVYVETYGCQMNFSDSEIVLSILSDFGYNESGDIEIVVSEVYISSIFNVSQPVL